MFYNKLLLGFLNSDLQPQKTSSYKLRFFILFAFSIMKNTIIKGTSYTYKKLEPIHNGKNDIFDLYARPSYTKIRIFKEWEQKLDCIYGLVGNSCTFSIYGYVYDEDGQKHNVKITPSYNYIID